ncbi:hypothetical protein LDENG_00173570, partial [Lucifuga dentata]
MEGGSVTLNCSSDANPAATYTWYKEDRMLSQGSDGQFQFTSISSEDRGIYYCKPQNKHGHFMSMSLFLDVQYAPKIPSVSVSPSGEIIEGSSVTLICSSDANPAATYTWYREDRILSQGSEGWFHFTSISSEDRRLYYCKSENKHGHFTSVSLFLDVQYAPKLSLVSVSPSGEMPEGSSVTLICISDANPAATYTWYKQDRILHQGSVGQFRITSISSEDRGIYCCKSENEHGHDTSGSLFLDVQ